MSLFRVFFWDVFLITGSVFLEMLTFLFFSVFRLGFGFLSWVILLFLGLCLRRYGGFTLFLRT